MALQQRATVSTSLPPPSAPGMPTQFGPGQDLDEVIAAGCREILATPRYAQQAQALAAEIAALPAPCEIVHTLETLADRLVTRTWRKAS